MTPEEIEALILRDGHGETGATEDETRQRRTELLAGALTGIRQQWEAAPDEADGLAEKLANASRDETWRVPLGDSGIIEFFLGILGRPNISQGLKIHALRLIGNSCADTDENREKVVRGNHIPTIMTQLSERDMLPFAIPVLFNIMVDYEPAQLQACNAALSSKLVNLLSGPQLATCMAFINIICKMLALLVSQDPEPGVALTQTPLVLLTLATKPDIAADLEDFVSLTSVAIAYLSHASFQPEFIASGGIPVFLSVVEMAHTGYDIADVDDPDLVAQLKQLWKALFNAIADITGVPEFTETCPLGGPIFSTLQSWLMHPTPGLQSAACLALGNLCRSDETSLLLVRTYKLHTHLVALLDPQSTTETQLLHSVLSFLKNLAIPTLNKPLLGDTGLLSSTHLPRIWSLDTNPQVQFAAISLTRLLLVGCAVNVARLCTPLSPDPSSPAHELTTLSHLVDVFDRSDAEPTKMEAARAVAAVCRVLHSVPVVPILPGWDPREEAYVYDPMEKTSLFKRVSGDFERPAEQKGDDVSSSKAREKFYKHHGKIMKPLAHLVTQTKFPTLRSETFFVLALMARSREGAEVVVRVFQVHEAFRAVMEIVTGRKVTDGDLEEEQAPAQQPSFQEEASVQHLGAGDIPDLGGLAPQQVDNAQRTKDMERVDRENCLVLVSEMVKWKSDSLSPLRRHYLEKMLQEGGEMVVAAQKEGEQGGQSEEGKRASDELLESFAYKDGF